MNKIFRSAVLLVGLALVRETSAQQFLVYRDKLLERPFVISRYYVDPITKLNVSEVIEAKTLSTKAVGAATEVTLSNVVIFIAQIPQSSPLSPGAQIDQNIATADNLTLRLDGKERIVENGTILENGINQVKHDSAPEMYEGTNAVQHLKDEGLWPPPEPKGQ